MYERQLPMRRPNRTKIKLRRNADGGSGHTSFRLSDQDKALLRKLADKKYGGVTMSACLRIVLRDACAKEGIE